MGSSMQATYEFRVNSDYADRLFRPDEGKELGSVRVIRISPDDSRFPEIGELSEEIDRETAGRAYFYAGWTIRYRCTQEELVRAKAFKLWPTHTFEPAGEECGTIYDESTACPHCGAGSTQVSDLRLDLRRVPNRKDLARTIAGEIVVSQRLAELLIDGKFKGVEVRPVRHKTRYEDDPLNLSEVPSGREILKKAEAADAPHPTGRFWVWLNRSENRGLYEQARKEHWALKHKTVNLSEMPSRYGIN